MKEIVEIISEIVSKNTIEPGKGNVVILKKEAYEEVLRKISNTEITSLFSSGNQTLFEFRRFPIKLYLNVEHFLKDFTENVLDKDFAILNYSSKAFYYQAGINSNIKGVYSPLENNYLIENTLAIYKLKKYICSSEFADYNNTQEGEVVFYTSTKGIFRLKYKSFLPFISDTENISLMIYDVLERLKDKKFVGFLKNACFESNRLNDNNDFEVLINILKNLVVLADRDYQLYLKNFSFDDFVNKLRIEKDKYFSSNREILSKILSQIISFPVSISAALFASYKIENQNLFLFLIISFCVYIYYVVHIELAYLLDIRLLKKQLDADFGIIIEKSGFDIVEINKEKKLIFKKLQESENLLVIFCGIFIFVSIIFLCYIYNIMVIYQTSVFIVLLFFGIVIISKFFDKVLEKN